MFKTDRSNIFKRPSMKMLLTKKDIIFSTNIICVNKESRDSYETSKIGLCLKINLGTCIWVMNILVSSRKKIRDGT